MQMLDADGTNPWPKPRQAMSVGGSQAAPCPEKPLWPPTLPHVRPVAAGLAQEAYCQPAATRGQCRGRG